MIGKPVLFAVACAALAACGTSAHDESAVEIFKYSTRADTFGRDADDPGAEMKRMEELGRQLQIDKKCPKGFTITSRRAIVQIGQRDQVDYEGKCNA